MAPGRERRHYHVTCLLRSPRSLGGISLIGLVMAHVVTMYVRREFWCTHTVVVLGNGIFQ